MGDIYRIRELGYLQKKMDMIVARQNAAASNISNASTPGYKAVEVNFEKRLAEAMGKGLGMKETHPSHMPTSGKSVYGVKPTFEEKLDGARADGNTVDLEKEFSETAVNTMEYRTLIAALNMHMKNIISSFEEPTTGQ